MTVEIRLYGSSALGRFALVDEGDQDLVGVRRWIYSCGYAKTVNPFMITGSIGMHSLIMRPPAGLVVHHKDGNRLNNCRSNLEIMTRRENSLLPVVPLDSTEHEGVYVDRFTGKFTVRLYLEGRRHHYGSYRSIDKAISVRDAEIKFGSASHNKINK